MNIQVCTRRSMLYCCLPCAFSSERNFLQCKCLDPNHKPKCGLPKYKGDGNCDDENNIKECAYDGGDCCLTAVKKNYCKQV